MILCFTDSCGQCVTLKALKENHGLTGKPITDAEYLEVTGSNRIYDSNLLNIDALLGVSADALTAFNEGNLTAIAEIAIVNGVRNEGAFAIDPLIWEYVENESNYAF